MAPYVTHPDEGCVYVCPHCDTSPPFRRKDPGPDEQEFVCYECGHEFSSPEERCRHQPGPGPDPDPDPVDESQGGDGRDTDDTDADPDSAE